MDYSSEELARIRLSAVEGIGRKRMDRLLELFGSAEALWENTDAPELSFLGSTLRNRLRESRTNGLLERLLEDMRRTGMYAVTRVSEDYPPLLEEIYDPPEVLYVRGSCALYGDRMFAIVGSRRCTRDGRRAASELAEGLAREAVTIVSGMARGTDTAAHEGALNGNGRTIAVFGCGADVIYPPENAGLAQRILDTGGALVSEYPPGTQPNAGLFPARNRIISGLTYGTLIVEGAKGSGAMITVNLATEQDRDVFAVPGSIYSALSAIPNRLIVEGAHPVISPWEILEYYRWAYRPEKADAKKQAPALSDEELSVVRPLSEQSLTLGELLKVTQIPISRLNSLLTMLELRGIIEKVPGGMYRAFLRGLSE